MEQKNIYDGLKTIQPSKCTYVARKDAESFIQRCKENDIGILGFDGLYCGEGYTQADLDLIADFSKLFSEIQFFSKSQKESCLAAEEIIQDFPADETLYIDFVLKEKS